MTKFNQLFIVPDNLGPMTGERFFEHCAQLWRGSNPDPGKWKNFDQATHDRWEQMAKDYNRIMKRKKD